MERFHKGGYIGPTNWGMCKILLIMNWVLDKGMIKGAVARNMLRKQQKSDIISDKWGCKCRLWHCEGHWMSFLRSRLCQIWYAAAEKISLMDSLLPFENEYVGGRMGISFQHIWWAVDSKVHYPSTGTLNKRMSEVKRTFLYHLLQPSHFTNRETGI